MRAEKFHLDLTPLREFLGKMTNLFCLGLGASGSAGAEAATRASSRQMRSSMAIYGAATGERLLRDVHGKKVPRALSLSATIFRFVNIWPFHLT